MRCKSKSLFMVAIFLIFVFSMVLPGYSAPSPGIDSCFQGKVVAVVDGDTIKVMHEGRAEKVRLEGIDCPEKGQAFGKRASQFTAAMVMGKVVTVETVGRDIYGRTLGVVSLADGRNLNRELVRTGLAWWYRHFSSDNSLGDLEAEARAAHRGLWRDPHPVAPWEYRRIERRHRKIH
jgi:micrococcal nuclease